MPYVAKDAPGGVTPNEPEEVQMRPANPNVFILPTDCKSLYIPYSSLETRAEASGTLQDNIRRDHASFADEATARRWSPEDGLSDPSSPRTDSPDVDVAALNFAKAICLSRILYPLHEPSSGSALAPKQRTQPGFLLLLAGA
ncbi:hypothetical protein LTR07_006593 [Exophiala xenobiotica]|nr:hypothetical protein LTR79_007452 [Exophiala xenobiotica]KAK5491346.1 hypothetical protein LTR83_006187 [Exophiala xenobiotica]KAK5516811.1 hypothetical protein LTR07_006593 [Exophiala xenobiotica]